METMRKHVYNGSSGFLFSIIRSGINIELKQDELRNGSSRKGLYSSCSEEKHPLLTVPQAQELIQKGAC